jgi:hypothetical protein
LGPVRRELEQCPAARISLALTTLQLQWPTLELACAPARPRHAAALEQEEGADGFQKRQGLYAIVTELAKSHRLSRFLDVAEKSGPA